MTEIVPTSAITLDTLAVEIRNEVEAAEADFQSAVAHAIRAGELLLEAKATVGHGGWIPWLERNFPKSTRSAQGYTRLARRAEDAQALAHLGIEGTLRELAAPKRPTIADVEHKLGRPIADLEQEIKTGLLTTRLGLHHLYRGKAHTTLGYPSWLAFVEAEFPIPDDWPEGVAAMFRADTLRPWAETLELEARRLSAGGDHLGAARLCIEIGDAHGSPRETGGEA